MSRSRTLWVLSLFFTWASFKGAGYIYNPASVTDYALLSARGSGWLFYAFNLPITLLEAATAYLLFAGRSVAYPVGIAAIVLECINSTTTSFIAVLNLDRVQEIYIASREARGLAVKPDSTMEFLLSAQGILLMLLAYIVFYVVIYYYLRKTKSELAAESA